MPILERALSPAPRTRLAPAIKALRVNATKAMPHPAHSVYAATDMPAWSKRLLVSTEAWFTASATMICPWIRPTAPAITRQAGTNHHRMEGTHLRSAVTAAPTAMAQGAATASRSSSHMKGPPFCIASTKKSMEVSGLTGALDRHGAQATVPVTSPAPDETGTP